MARTNRTAGRALAAAIAGTALGAARAGAEVLPGGVVWVEAESAAERDVRDNPGLNAVDADELSGGAWVSHFAEEGQPAGTLTVPLDLPTGGPHTFWLRGHSGGTGLAYRVDGGPWVEVDAKAMRAADEEARKAHQRKKGKDKGDAPEPRVVDDYSVSIDGSPGFKQLAWTDLGPLELAAGGHEIEFRLGGDDVSKKRYSAVDCLALVPPGASFEPNAKFKPGEPGWADVVTYGDDQTWAFDPPKDPLDDSAAFDLRSMNEREAGEHGFIARTPDGADFARGDGAPIRFWGGTDYNQRDLSVDDLRRHARFLAKRGVNVVRWHGDLPTKVKPKWKLPKDAPPQPEPRLDAVDEYELDEAFKLVAAMKREGIYTVLSPFWAPHADVQPTWGLGGDDNKNLAGQVFFHKPVQDAYRAWLRELYTRPNPYTGVPLKDEPAVAVIQLQNEDSLLFYTLHRLRGAPLLDLRRQFGEWVERKYGSMDAAREAWQGYAPPLNDGQPADFADGTPGIALVWEFTPKARQEKGDVPGFERRTADQLQFMAETMRAFNAETARYLREDLGCKQLINAGNWRTVDRATADDAERWSYAANEVIGKNHYFDGQHLGVNVGWQIKPHQYFSNVSATRKPWLLPTNVRQVAGHPFIVPESLWVPPNLYQSEGPLMTAAQTSLTGVDTLYWFSNGEPEWTADPAKKWTYATPTQLGQFPAAALIYRNGYVTRADRPAVAERRPLSTVWGRATPSVVENQAYDPNRDAGPKAESSGDGFAGTVDPLAFVVGPVVVEYVDDRKPDGKGDAAGDAAGDAGVTAETVDLSEYVDRDAGVARGLTGETAADYGRGLYTVDAPKAQAAAGFLGAAGPVELADVTIDSGNDYAAVAVVPLDDRPIAESGRVLVQVGTVARPTGWRARPATFAPDGTADGTKVEGFRILDVGRPPTRVVNTQVTVTVANPSLGKATLLDANAVPVRGVPVTRDGDRLSVELPPETMYLVLE